MWIVYEYIDSSVIEFRGKYDSLDECVDYAFDQLWIEHELFDDSELIHHLSQPKDMKDLPTFTTFIPDENYYKVFLCKYLNSYIYAFRSV